MLINTLFKVQFSYCPPVWMIHNRRINNKIKRLQERCFCIVYNQKSKFLWRTFSIGQFCFSTSYEFIVCCYWIVEDIDGFSPDIMRNIFPLNTPSIYDIRNWETFYTRPVPSHYHSWHLKCGISILKLSNQLN